MRQKGVNFNSHFCVEGCGHFIKREIEVKTFATQNRKGE